MRIFGREIILWKILENTQIFLAEILENTQIFLAKILENTQIFSVCKGKSFKTPDKNKAFALSGRKADCAYTQGVTLG